MVSDSMQLLAEVAETLDNLTGALMLPMQPAFHVQQMKVQLPELRDKLRQVYAKETGENPWD